MAVSHTHKILVSVKSLGGVPDCSIYPQPIADLSSGTVLAHEAPSCTLLGGQPAGISVPVPVPGTTTTTGSSVLAGTEGTTGSVGTGAAGTGSTGTTGSVVAGTAGTTGSAVVAGIAVTTTGSAGVVGTAETTAASTGAAVVTDRGVVVGATTTGTMGVLVGAGTGSAGTGVVVGATTIGTGTLVSAGTTGGTGTALGGAAEIVPSHVQSSPFATAQPQVADSLTGTPLVVTVCEKLQDASANPPLRVPAHEVPSPGKLGGHVVVSVGGPGVTGIGIDEVGNC
mmetsp:Transcript_39035/g.44618  ORF Transcript_39035/g.44618 Transcript_39035/m.44618 type:complete len:283 (-) Transcript_39035:271-1119(-)